MYHLHTLIHMSYVYPQICLTRKGNTTIIEAPFKGSGCCRVVQGAGRKAKYFPLFDSYKNDDTARARNSNDVVLDTRGKELLELCKSNQLRIANGRCIGDIFGNFTCFNPLGQSTVDFLLTSESFFSQILYFKVSNFILFLSGCHSKISWEILAKYKDNYSNKTNTSTSKLPLNYIWTNDSGVKFQEVLKFNYHAR